MMPLRSIEVLQHAIVGVARLKADEARLVSCLADAKRANTRLKQLLVTLRVDL